jgi:hypothetical protein
MLAEECLGRKNNKQNQALLHSRGIPEVDRIAGVAEDADVIRVKRSKL